MNIRRGRRIPESMSSFCRVSTTDTLVMLLPILEPRVCGCLRQPARFWTRFSTPQKSPMTTSDHDPGAILRLRPPQPALGLIPSSTYIIQASPTDKWLGKIAKSPGHGRHTAAIPPSPRQSICSIFPPERWGTRSLSTAASQNLGRHTKQVSRRQLGGPRRPGKSH